MSPGLYRQCEGTASPIQSMRTVTVKTTWRRPSSTRMTRPDHLHGGTHRQAVRRCLTHRNLCAELDMIQQVFRRQPDDVGLCLIPLFHSFGATVNMLNVIQAGCST